MQRLRGHRGRGLYKEVLQAAPSVAGLQWVGCAALSPGQGRPLAWQQAQQGTSTAQHGMSSPEQGKPGAHLRHDLELELARSAAPLAAGDVGCRGRGGLRTSGGSEVVGCAQATRGRGLQAAYPASRCGAAGSRQAGKSAEDGCSSLLNPLGQRNAKNDRPWALGPVLSAHPGPGCSCCWAREAWPPHQSSTAGTATAPFPPGHSARGRGKALEKREARRPTKIPPPGCPRTPRVPVSLYPRIWAAPTLLHQAATKLMTQDNLGLSHQSLPQSWPP